MTAIIHYSTYRTEYRKSVRITEYLQTEEESLRGRLLKALKAADQASKGEDYLTLPVSLDGKKISWEYAGDWPAGAGILLFIILIAAVLARENEHLKNELERRSQMLLDAYPVFVHRMVLMLGAGITPLKSWEILLADIEKENRGSENLSYLRREMRYSLLQLRSGVPEVSVYREFGSRTGLACYEQFCQLIVQSIKKGRKGIGDMMMNEAQDAQKRRRDTAKKMGETASTKLLGPMMMMLVAVIAVVMAPALLEM